MKICECGLSHNITSFSFFHHTWAQTDQVTKKKKKKKKFSDDITLNNGIRWFVADIPR